MSFYAPLEHQNFLWLVCGTLDFFVGGLYKSLDLYLGIFIHIGKIIQADDLLNEIHTLKNILFRLFFNNNK